MHRAVVGKFRKNAREAKTNHGSIGFCGVCNSSSFRAPNLGIANGLNTFDIFKKRYDQKIKFLQLLKRKSH